MLFKNNKIHNFTKDVTLTHKKEKFSIFMISDKKWKRELSSTTSQKMVLLPHTALKIHVCNCC